jgi:hypothetical protein
MADAALIKRWKVIETLLRRARGYLPEEPDDPNVARLLQQFTEFIDHNELGLALDTLEEIGEFIHCRGRYWRDLERAALTMDLNERAAAFHKKFLTNKPQLKGQQ